MNIYVGGVNGVGKSTILRQVAKIDKRFEIIHYSSAVMQHLGLQPGDYAGFHQIDMQRCNQATQEVLAQLINRQTTKIRLIDGHYLAIRDGTIATLAGSWIAGLDALILVTATPEILWNRLQIDDRGHNRRIFKPGASTAAAKAEVSRNVTATLAEFEDWSRRYQKDHFVLTHNDDDVDRAAGQLTNFVNSLG